MFKLQQDIVNELEKRYPSLDVNKFIHDLFDLILQKTLSDGSATIRQFGKFGAYLTNSGRTGKLALRFKFRLSTTLNNKISSDPYILNKLPINSKHAFEDKHEECCKDKRNKRDNNYQALTESYRMGKVRTMENLAREEILNAINNAQTDL